MDLEYFGNPVLWKLRRTNSERSPRRRHVSGHPLRLGPHQPQDFGFRAMRDRALQQSFQRLPRPVVLLQISGAEPYAFLAKEKKIVVTNQISRYIA